MSKLKTLINGGVNPHARRESGRTALDCTKERRDQDIINFLSRVGACNIELCEDFDSSSAELAHEEKAEESECP